MEVKAEACWWQRPLVLGHLLRPRSDLILVASLAETLLS